MFMAIMKHSIIIIITATRMNYFFQDLLSLSIIHWDSHPTFTNISLAISAAIPSFFSIYLHTELPGNPLYSIFYYRSK